MYIEIVMFSKVAYLVINSLVFSIQEGQVTKAMQNLITKCLPLSMPSLAAALVVVVMKRLRRYVCMNVSGIITK